MIVLSVRMLRVRKLWRGSVLKMKYVKMVWEESMNQCLFLLNDLMEDEKRHSAVV